MYYLTVPELDRRSWQILSPFIPDKTWDEPLFLVRRAMVSSDVCRSFTEEEIIAFVRRPQLGEWGCYKMHWDQHCVDRFGLDLSVCSSFELHSDRRLLVKTSGRRNRTIVRFDRERLETKRHGRYLRTRNESEKLRDFRGP